jgi:cytochrome b
MTHNLFATRRKKMNQEHERIPVWDPALRLFHWALVACVVGAVVSVKIGGNAMRWHEAFGLAVLGLIVWRLQWGFVGPQTARFSAFVRGPREILTYLRGQWHGLGHNPLGALSVLALLGLFGLQAVLGLFTYDEIAFRGPLAPLVDSAWQLRLTGWHRALEPLLWLIVLLHVGAIVFYAVVKKEDLVRPMITGYRRPPSGVQNVPPVEWGNKAYALRLALTLVVALAVVYGASGAWIPAPAPVAPVPGMDW